MSLFSSSRAVWMGLTLLVGGCGGCDKDGGETGDSADDTGDSADSADSGDSTDSHDTETGPADADGDGYTEDVDCDDADAAVHPDADEVCNGLDDDCNGDVDEDDSGLTDASTFYEDGDDDGYGATGSPITACEAPAGYGLGNGDCDDADAAINPGADEICDGIDNDCDGAIDDEDSDVSGPIWYADEDGDGYGDPGNTTSACDAPAGYGADSSDCDDGDAAIHPDATELSADGVDEDCDGGEICYTDTDGDSYGSTSPKTSTDADCADAGESLLNTDCDDANAAIYPGATEITADEIDESCDGGEVCYADTDRDGYGATTTKTSTDTDCDDAGESSLNTDCDDSSASVNPGETEICDAADTDEDCDGSSDDDDASVASAGKTTWYRDADSDTYGDSATTTSKCDLPSGYGTDKTDCDDTKASVHPGATELTGDEVDQNCDNKEKCWVDADSDGYRTSTSTVTSADSDCKDTGEAANAATEECADADDAEETVNPDAATVCNDGLVNDCDGGTEEAELDTCVLGQDPDIGSALTSANAEAVRIGASKSEGAGGAVAGAGDVDGDGADDLWVGASGYSSGAGAAYLLGGPLATGSTTISTAPTAWLKGSSTDESFGISVAQAGDLDGDGYADGILGGAGTGAAYLVSGPVTGTSKVSSVADSTLWGKDPKERAGVSVAGLGDFDGDGTDDVAVGEELVNYPTTVADNGGTWVVSGPVASGTQYLYAAYALFLYGEATLDYAGNRVAAAGDFDGDGVADILVGAYGANGGRTDSGAAYLVLGGSDVTGYAELGGANLIVRGEAKNDALGTSLSGGADVDGDGYADIAVGAPGNDSAGTGAGAAYVVFGARTFSSALDASRADVLIYGAAAGDALGTSVAMDADANRDGIGDLLLGAPAADGSGTDSGAAYLFYTLSSGTLLLSGADVRVSGATAGDGLGSAASFAGDTRDDGTLGILLGAPGYDASSTKTNAGAAVLFVGGSY